MRRRTFITTVGAGLLAQAPLINTARAAAASNPKSSTPAAREPFIKIAKAKGVKISFDDASAQAEPDYLHLDMNMVRSSIENAISSNSHDPVIADKLRRLLAKGTAVEQVEFVHGSGRYYFPEDVKKAIELSELVKAQSDAQCWVCVPVCYLVCTCKGNGDQYCKDRCRDVCHKYC